MAWLLIKERLNTALEIPTVGAGVEFLPHGKIHHKPKKGSAPLGAEPFLV